MRIITLLLALLVVVAFVGNAMAVGAGKTVEFAGGKEGKVVFSGDTHKVNKCNDCHPKTFQMKKGSTKITAPHEAGKFCGSCHDGKEHNGKVVFAQEGNCAKCHKK
ncbi:MAG: cytochrome C [Nitrospirae bacterium]|nr:cytochrome C [Nitrospirota bacterium]